MATKNVTQATGCEKKKSAKYHFSQIKIEEWMGKQVEEIVKSYVK